MTESTEPSRSPQAILGLDGLRAVSVIAVLLFHASFDWMRGGFLGVEVFFVISGFLITGLLIRERERRGRINLGRFWQRRLRRLLPALVAFLLCVSTFGIFYLGTRASQFRTDLLMSMAYLENWYQLHSGGSYFADQGLPLLRHLWSLAVEGQFYLVWPLLVAGTLRCAKGRTWPLVALTAALAAASCAWALRLADPFNVSGLKALASLNRVYLGTDTRACGLLAGALLALTLRPGPAGRRGPGWSLDLAALAALAGLGLLMVQTDIQTPFLYRGGLLLVDALTLVVIAALVAPSARVVRAILGWAPLEWLGRRSYGLYLWHWPVFRCLAPAQHDPAWFGLRVLTALLLTELSYRCLEVPIRRGALQRWWSAPASCPAWRRDVLRLAFATLAAASLWESKALADRAPYLDPVAEAIQAGAVALDNGPASIPPAGTEQAVPTPAITAADLPLCLKGMHLTAIGDSVMKGAAIPLKRIGEASLGAGMIQINAEECRPFYSALEILRDYKRENRLGDVVVVHLGTNNSAISEDSFRKLMDLLGDRRSVLFLTAKSDKLKACETVNRTLESLAAEFPNARVLDWKTAADAHPEYFYSDQTHLRPEGARRYAELILNQFALPERAEPVNGSGDRHEN